ncbi:MAG TPA: hypothetical protein VGR20_19545 [Acidimicrobiia bacterium]|nr:hypothetical protein [Acidimicrobiia bacterium]
MRKLMAAALAASMLLGGVACDDNKNSGKQGIDKDDTNVGPGDGRNEVGPGR